MMVMMRRWRRMPRRRTATVMTVGGVWVWVWVVCWWRWLWRCPSSTIEAAAMIDIVVVPASASSSFSSTATPSSGRASHGATELVAALRRRSPAAHRVAARPDQF